MVTRAQQRIVRSAPREELVVSVNEIFGIENDDPSASTGYEWSLQGPLPKEIRVIDEERTPPPPGSPIGAPGKVTWFFKGIAPCKTDITLVLARPWEIEPAQQEITHVVIQ